MYDQWTIAVFSIMSGYCPAIFRGYRVTYVGLWQGYGMPEADNDDGFVVPNV